MESRTPTPPDAGPEVFAAGATYSAGPSIYAAASGTHSRLLPRRKRWLRRFILMFASLLTLLVLAALLAWHWLGRDDSLAYVLQRASQMLPADQQLQTEGVRGSLRRGGHIDRLRWHSSALSVDAQDIDIGWSLAPLLQKSLRLGKLEAARVVVRPAPDAEATPPTPLQQLSLPLRIDIPFAVQELVWAEDKPLEVKALSGRYRYDGSVHHLEIAGVDMPQGHASADIRVDGSAPMALEATLKAQLQAQLPGDKAGDERTLSSEIEVQAKGTLAGQDARLALTAMLRATPQEPPVAEDAPHMQMDASASVAPWATQPLLALQADLQGVDLAALLPQAPATVLSGHVAAGPTQGGWDVEANLTNAHPAPWDKKGLPVDAVTAHAHFDGSQWSTQDARVQVGKGTLALQGHFAPESQSIALKAQVQHLDPAQLHTALAAAPLNGHLAAEGSLQDLQFELQLTASTGSRARNARKGAPAALRIDRVAAHGTWKDGVLHLPQVDLTALQAQLKASDVQFTTRPALAISGKIEAKLPGTTAHADGQLAANRGAGTLRVDAVAAQQTLQWVRSLPGLTRLTPGFAARGSAALNVQWRGGWEGFTTLPKGTTPPSQGTPSAQLQASFDAPQLQLNLPSAQGATPAPIELRGVHLRAAGSAAQAELSIQGELRQGKQSAAVQSSVIAHLVEATDKGSIAASAQVQSLGLTLADGTHQGRWALQAGAPFAIEAHRSADGALALKADAGSAALTAPLPGKVALRWEPLTVKRSAGGALALQTRGAITGIPLTWADLVGTQEPSFFKQFGLDTDLVFGGQWAVDAGEELSASIRLQRSSGDLRIAMEDAPPATSVQSQGDGAKATAVRKRADTIAAGLRDISLTLSAKGDTLRAAFTWDSTQAGEVHAEASTRLQRQDGSWSWPGSAALSGTVHAKLPQVGVWSVLAPPGWRISGTLEADAALSGTRSAPQWNGQISADQLTVRSLLDGVDLQDGHLRASLAGNRVDITAFSLKGGRSSSARIAGFGGNRTPPPIDGGSLEGSGSVQWGPGSNAAPDLRMDFKARAQKLQILVRADRQASVSGTLEATLRERQFKLRGDLHIDRASILLPDASAPSLGADVVVHSKARDAAAQKNAQQAASAAQHAPTVLPPDVAVTLDLGNDFAFQGQGITTRLEGKLDIRSSTLPNTPPRVVGEVRTVAGRYRAWGQMLDVETGLVRFTGPYNNPALDILALRPNIDVRAGVQVAGTALDPRVSLYSDPDLPDAEKLSWVVLGRSAAAGGAEAAVLQQAALALLGGKGGGAGEKVASRLGLDEIGFKGPGTGGDATGAALTFGKRVSKDLYLTYERSLSGTLGTLYIFYDLSKRLRLRAQTGASTGLDLIYTMRYE